ncbi:LysM peptidoglycan-binding domain-containing protein [Draconibacterium sp. IB214405]|uniref:LysM peptidoglycan-binding domain-containing protein n=1 Tax=Draconibacterium sp. IB214405 TaxID=3097352 RepID=UPI002A0D5F88|nr:LysM peptidoglycan-binding domain-containing protein [Draconibacterium sp. IB214405]MDX8340114.1 LysM peptidoglycan-binding domain-containing protein [Draconibacterium sp. IB214405]
MKHIILFLLISGLIVACSTSQKTTQNDQENLSSEYTSEPALSADMENQEPEESLEPIIHVVEKGESLWVIAQKYGVTVQDLVEANNIEDRSLIKVGQKLMIPKKSRN